MAKLKKFAAISKKRKSDILVINGFVCMCMCVCKIMVFLTTDQNMR